MNIEAMRCFLSEDTVNTHLEHYRRERCKCSIIEKSFPEIKGKGLREILELPMARATKSEILPSFISAKSHELYFNSFCERRRICPDIKEYYSSEAAFLYELSEHAKKIKHGFLYVFRDRYGAPRAVASDEITPMKGFAPCLALDMSEHAYFLDYRFERDKYISAALARLDLGEIFSQTNCNLYLDTPV